ncbi:MAG: apolipoprotein N-acyltransferase [Propionibacteriales bacterium]|nr:apolipoprotein N-acyltransferase [Propionibacteriales bacterium]
MRSALLAGLLGVALALAMPPLGWWPLALVAVAGLGLLCRDASLRAAAVRGLLFGFTFVLVAAWWLYSVVPGIQFAIAAVEAPFYLVLGLALAATSRLPGWPVWGACAWAGVELARGHLPFGGFPWARLGTPFVDTGIVSWARYLGEGGLTFVVALAALLLAAAVVGRHRLLLALPAAVAALALLAAGWVLPVGLHGTEGRTATVAVVQGDTPGEGIDSMAEPRVVLENHATATHDLAADIEAGRAEQPDVVVWPENSSDIDPLLDADAGALIQDAVDAVGVPVLVGAVTRGPGDDHVQGTGIVWEPTTGPGETYAKRRLVPFGEWVPLRAAFTPIVPLLEQEIPRDFFPGDGPGVLDLGDVRMGAVMCFEVAYDEAIRDVAGEDVDLLAVQTNNATYLGTAQLEQQWAITRLRAVETGRAVAVAATTGISGFVRPDGSVLDRTTSRAQQALVAEVPIGEGTTPGIRLGGWFDLAAAGLGLVGVAVGVVRRRARERG